MSEFFLGGSSPGGFKTEMGDVFYDGRCFTYIIKGTAGSGKSTLMKKIAAAFPDEDKEIFRCSADPESLDGLYLKDKNIAVVDGTAPHIFEPKYPYAYQATVDMGNYLNGAALYEQRQEIAAVTDEYSLCHKRCRRYLGALSEIYADIEQIGGDALNAPKLEGFAERTAKKLLPKKHGAEKGSISHRSLSAMTPMGYTTILPRDHTVYMLADDLKCAGELFLRRLAERAVSRGYDVTVSLNYIDSPPRYEHIIIPEIKTAFIAQTSGCKSGDHRTLGFRRFYDKAALSAKRPRLKFDRGAAAELADEAAAALKAAKAIHDKLESYYIAAADFGGINRLGYRLIAEIKSR